MEEQEIKEMKPRHSSELKRSPGPFKLVWTTREDIEIVADDGHQVAVNNIDPDLCDQNLEIGNFTMFTAARDLFDFLKNHQFNCLGVDENNDMCGSTFTCYQCKQSDLAAKILEKALGMP